MYGTSLAPSVAQPAGLPLPTALNGVRVRIWADYARTGALGEAPLLYVSPGQINAVLPPAIPAGIRYATVAVGDVESPPASIQVTAGRFTAFAMNSAGTGPAAIQQVDAAGYPWLNRLSAPAIPGQAMTLWGTGLGTATAVSVLVAGVPAETLYAGPAPGLPGVDQINFVLPAGVPRRCFVPLVVRTGAAASGVVTMAVSADGGPCASEFGLSREVLARLDGGGVARGAVLSVTTSTDAATGAVTQQAEAWVAEYDAASLSVPATRDLLPLGDGDGVCSERSYTWRLHQEAPLLESGIYGLRRTGAWLSANCIGPSPGTDGVYRGQGCASQAYWLSGAGFQGSGPLPAAKLAGTVGITGVEGTKVAWSAAPSSAGDRMVLTVGSAFSYGGNIFGPTSEVNELACQVGADRSAAEFPAAASGWAVSKPDRMGPAVALTDVAYQMLDPGSSGLDFVLVRTRTLAVAGQ
ncbi:MAG: hypothetical protein JST11_28800 [Acidobacteria bacterium]|nr:hypothetical protein [Acidobacteriota bacterium]